MNKLSPFVYPPFHMHMPATKLFYRPQSHSVLESTMSHPVIFMVMNTTKMKSAIDILFFFNFSLLLDLHCISLHFFPFG